MEIDIEDYLDEASDMGLENELRNRKKYKDIPINIDLHEAMLWVANFRKLTAIEQIKFILKLKPYATKEEIIKEINEL